MIPEPLLAPFTDIISQFPATAAFDEKSLHLRIGSIRTHYGESGVGVASDVGVFRLTMGIMLGRMASSSV